MSGELRREEIEISGYAYGEKKILVMKYAEVILAFSVLFTII